MPHVDQPSGCVIYRAGEEPLCALTESSSAAKSTKACFRVLLLYVRYVGHGIANLIWSASKAKEGFSCWNRAGKTQYTPHRALSRVSGDQTFGLSGYMRARIFGIRTQARSARFNIGRVSSRLPNKIPVRTQSRTFAESSSVMRRSDRPKMVSLGILKQLKDDILL